MKHLLVIGFTLPLLAQQPATFKGFKLGGTQAEAKTIEELDCKVNRVHASLASCRQPMPDLSPSKVRSGGLKSSAWDIGGAFVIPSFEFIDDSLVDLHGYFQSGSFDILKDVFETKYGKPSSDLKSPVQNGLGNTFTNEVVTWRTGSIVVQITKFNGSIKDGGFDVYPSAHFAKLQKGSDEMKKKAAAGL